MLNFNFLLSKVSPMDGTLVFDKGFELQVAQWIEPTLAEIERSLRYPLRIQQNCEIGSFKVLSPLPVKQRLA
jgi:hypothetical protein